MKIEVGMEKGSLYEMYKQMIINAEQSNDKEGLKAIKMIIHRTPMKYIVQDALTTSQANYLEERIDLNLWEGEDK